MSNQGDKGIFEKAKEAAGDIKEKASGLMGGSDKRDAKAKASDLKDEVVDQTREITDRAEDEMS